MATNTTSGKRTRTPKAMTHQRAVDCPGPLAGGEIAEIVAVVAVGRSPGGGEVAVKENVLLTG